MDQNFSVVLKYWSVLIRRRWVIYLAVATVTLVSLVGSFLVTPLYRATVTLQIQRQTPDILNIRDLAQLDYSWSAYSDFYQTQYKIIASSDVAYRAVERLGLTSHPRFDAKQRKPGLMARVRALLPRKGSRKVQDPVDIAAQQLLGRLEVEPVKNSQLVRVSWVSEEPELAARVAGAMADAYIHFTLESKYLTTDQAQVFLLDQIGTLKKEIVAIEKKMQDYGEQRRIVSIEDTHNLPLQALKSAAAQRTVAETELASAKARFDALKDASPVAMPEVLKSSLIARLREESARYEAEYSEMSKRFNPDWPEMRALESKILQARERLQLESSHIASQVRAAAESEYLEALAEVKNLEALVRSQEQAAQLLKRDAVEYANLASEATKKRDALEALLQRQNEMALSTRLESMDTATSNIQIMEKARTPSTPFRPRTSFNVALGIILGLGLGVGLALVIEYMDNTIGSVEELRNIIALPVLAQIPRDATAKSARRNKRGRPDSPSSSFDLIAHADLRAGASEAYRGLRTAILLSLPGKPPRTIMATSAVPEEGKTSTILNLGTVLAQLGRRIVLVDTDLRRPRLHKVLGVEGRLGVSTFLSGNHDEIEQLVAPTAIEHLDLLPSGLTPPNPSELLNSDMFSRMLERLAESYDHILLDSPPILAVSDPIIVSTFVDVTILVVRSGRTPRQWVQQAAERLGEVKTGFCGVVINDVNLQRTGAVYAYHSYARPDDQHPARADGAPKQASGVTSS